MQKYENMPVGIYVSTRLLPFSLFFLTLGDPLLFIPADSNYLSTYITIYSYNKKPLSMSTEACLKVDGKFDILNTNNICHSTFMVLLSICGVTVPPNERCHYESL